MSQGSDSQGVVAKGSSYFSEAVDELKKVSKPTAAEARQATLVTIALVLFVALVVALFDFLFSQLMNVVVT